MTPKDHEDYAAEILSSLGSGTRGSDLDFVPKTNKKRNAANAMTAILHRRLLSDSGQPPVPIRTKPKTFDWKQGTFLCRNITDRERMWTNILTKQASDMHQTAASKPAGYLLSCSRPGDTAWRTWAIPEPLMHECLAHLRPGERGQYSVEISIEKQRIEKWDASPDLTPYYRHFDLEDDEASVLEASRKMDALVKHQGRDRVSAETKNLLAAVERRLTESDAFNADYDGRERELSAVVRRRGQPAFRRCLLKAYSGRCAITGCVVREVLEAAHIVPYRGPNSDHLANGLLLRADLHTLFDLKLVAIDVETMTVLVSPELSDTEYEAYRGKPVRVPRKPGSRPSREALNKHRHETGL